MSTPYYQDDLVTIYHGDMIEVGLFAPGPNEAEAVTITDPPYGVTSLAWDRWPAGWPAVIAGRVLWCFGSLRMFMERAPDFALGRWRLSQDVIWEKQNGSHLFNDRFRRVHEQAALFYRGDWASVPREVQFTNDARPKTIRRKTIAPHLGEHAPVAYVSVDGGPRLMRSVLHVNSMHKEAENETQKPVAVLAPLIEYSVPVGGTVYDPFAGAGSVLVAAKALGRHAVGVEIRESQCEVAANRCRQEVLGLVSA